MVGSTGMVASDAAACSLDVAQGAVWCDPNCGVL